MAQMMGMPGFRLIVGFSLSPASCQAKAEKKKCLVADCGWLGLLLGNLDEVAIIQKPQY